MLATSILLIQLAMAQDTHNVTIHDLSFDPQVFYIEKGDMVVWTNNDEVIYTLWFEFSENDSTYLLSDPIPPGETWQHTFDTPTKLDYKSFERLWIVGTVKIYRLIGDVNGNGIVDIFDIGFISAHWYPGPPVGPLGYDEEADINLDESVDIFDIGITSAHWGETW